MAFVFVCLPAVAQQETEQPDKVQEERTFKLLRDSGYAGSDLEIADEEEEAWIPGIEKGTVEISFALGALNLNTLVLEHDQIIYKYTEEATYWGDVKMKGANAFSPRFRIGYNFLTWLSVEGNVAVSFGDYTSSAENRHRRTNEPGAPVIDDPPLGEFDLEKRSLFTANTGINATIYFLNFGDDGSGKWQPYATAGIGHMWYAMNSNYVDDPATTVDYNIGGGIRLLADRNISVRLEALYHFNSVQFTPSNEFTSLNDGTVSVPLYEFIETEEGLAVSQVTEFSSQSIRSLEISIGVQGSF